MSLKPPISPTTGVGSLFDDRLDVLEAGTSGGVVSAKDPAYGAAGDGLADDTTELQAAYTAAVAAGKPLYIPEGRYLLSAPLTGSSSSATAAHIYGDGPGKTVLVQTGDHRIIWITRTSGATINLGANATLGDTTLTVTSTSGIAADDWAELRSTVTVPGPKGSVEGEMVRIKSVDDGTTVTLYGPIEGSYTTANTGLIRLQPKIEGVNLRDFSVENEDAPNSGKTTADTVFLGHTYGARISNLAFEGLEQQALVMEDSIDWLVDSCTFINSSNDTGDLGYGVVANAACRGGIVRNCRMRRGRHLFTTGSTAGRSVPKHILIEGCLGEDMDGAPFDTHQEGQYITFADCVASRLTGSSNPGFNARCPDVTINNPIVYTSSRGIYVADADAAVRCTINGGHLREITGDEGLRVLADDCKIDGTRFERIEGYGLRWITGDRGKVKNVEVSDCGLSGNSETAAYFTTGEDHVVDGLLAESCPRALRVDTGVTIRIERVRERNCTNDWNANSGATYNTQKRITAFNAAATLTLPGGEDRVFRINSTADITSITATGQTGRTVTLWFTGTAATNGIVDGSNLKLAGNLAYTPDDTITLFCDGTNWFECGRSVN